MNTAPITHHAPPKLRSEPVLVKMLRLTRLAPSKPAKEKTGQFTVLAHEVRNPLSNINLAVAMLKSLISDNDQKTYLDIILRGTGRINVLVTDLLTSFRAKEMQSEKYSIHQLINEVIVLSEDRIRLKNISIRKKYAARDCKIILNKQKMKIALTNIIINAIDAMPSKNGILNLTTKSIAGKYVIQIEDNGCGISKANLKNIFNPYYTNKPGGLGLGLATTYDILQSNDVRVTVESKEGRGTRFILFFDKHHQYDPFQ